MTKWFLIFSCLIGVSKASALTDLTLSCETPWPTSSVYGKTVDGIFQMTVIHHGGVRNMPIYNGTVTSDDLPLLQGDSEALQQLGPRWDFSWKVADCKGYSAGIVNCPTGSPALINSREVTNAFFNTRRTNEKFFENEVNHAKIALWLTVDGRSRQVMFDYDMKDCVVRFTP